MDWWQKLTTGGPGSLSHWFWHWARILLVEQPAIWLRWRNLWRLGVFVVTVALAVALLRDFGPDAALLTAVDTSSLLEALTIIALIAARDHARQMLRLAAQLARRVVRGSAQLLRPAWQRVNELRNRRAHGVARPTPLHSDSEKSDEDRGPFAWGAWA